MNVARIARVGTAVLVVVGLTAALVPLVKDVFNRHVLSVRVAGKFEHVSRSNLEAVVREELASAGFFAVDVESLRVAATALPWVRDVTVRRVWPDSVHIAVIERSAIARWNDDALLESDGHMFKPRDGVDGYDLVRLRGPLGQHAQVLEEFNRLASGLGEVGGGVAGLSLSARGQWEVTLRNGMSIVPSTPFDIAALMQFTRTLPSILGGDMPRVARIDLRYANGFAVRWREAPNDGDGDAESVAKTTVRDARVMRVKGGEG